MNTKKLVSAVALVTVLGVIERFIGFLYRVYLSRSIGAEGLALYQIALSVAGVIITVTASGIPVTVSRLILKERARKNPLGEKEVVSAGIITCVAISLPMTVAMYVFKDKLSFVFTDKRCYDIFLTILPGITITSVYAVIRGYFWGNRQYLKYSLIELGEEVVMAVVGIIIVSGSADGFTGAKRAGVAVFVSYIVSFAVSSAVFISENGMLKNPIPMLKPLIVSSSPITATRTLTALVGMLIAIIVPKQLVDSGMETSAALAEYGKLSGMAFPMLFIPSTVIGSFALVLVPEISQSFYEKDVNKLKKTVGNSLDICTLVSALIIPVFVSCGKEIGSFIYDSADAGAYLSISAIIMLPMSVSMITTSLLNSMGKEKLTFINYVVGAAAMLAIVWLTPKFIGIYSLIAANLVSFAVTMTLNLAALKKTLTSKLGYLKPVLLCLVSMAAASLFGILLKGVIKEVSDIVTILIVGAAATAFDLVMLSVFGVVDINAIKLEILSKKKGKSRPISR